MTWPTHLRPGAIRFSRASARYDETIAFYRDVVGLPVIGGFRDSFDETGTIFGLPNSTVQLEVVRAHPAAPVGEIDMLVLYLADADAVIAATAPLREHGLAPLVKQHPYWEANGAVTFADPDGRQVVFVPWIYRVELDGVVHIELHAGPREELRASFQLAEDSPSELASYINKGRVLVARIDDVVVGHLQLVDGGRAGVVELKNMAVREDQQCRGIGAQLINAAVQLAAADGATTMLVSTAAESTGNLRFYQRQGFRLRSVDRDAFTAVGDYPKGIVIDGIPMRDRVWLDREL
jgi:GNAT superfamily N-acetyltransferase